MASYSGIPPIRLTKPSTGPSPVAFRRVCAWCGLETAREERQALSGDTRIVATVVTWGICPDCLELREETDDVVAREWAHTANRCSDGPEQEPRGTGEQQRPARAEGVPEDLAD